MKYDELNKHYSTIFIHLHNNGETTAIAEVNKKKDRRMVYNA